MSESIATETLDRKRAVQTPSSPRSPWTRLVLSALALFLVLGAVAPAVACPVCYGEAESGVIDGVRWAIVFMGALVYGLIGGGIALVIAVRRRALRQQDPHKGLTLVPPMAE